MTEKKSREQIASERLVQVALNAMNDNTVVENIEAGYVQGHLNVAALKGLTRALIHKGVFTEKFLSDSIAWAYEERASQIENAGKIQVAASPLAILKQ